jgi:hypothetical protein
MDGKSKIDIKQQELGIKLTIKLKHYNTLTLKHKTESKHIPTIHETSNIRNRIKNSKSK